MKTLIAIALLAVSGMAASAAPLPFPDGRYVTDSKLCAMTEDQMVSTHGDGISSMVRNIAGNELNNSYEMMCKIGRVRVQGDQVNFVARCESEDVSYRQNAVYRIISSDAFAIGKTVYRRCGSASAASAPSKPSSPPPWPDLSWLDEHVGDTNENVPELISLWHEKNSNCRGGSGDEFKTYVGCAARDIYSVALQRRGLCYGKEGQAGYEMEWHECGPNSNRD